MIIYTANMVNCFGEDEMILGYYMKFEDAVEAVHNSMVNEQGALRVYNVGGCYRIRKIDVKE